MSEKRFPIQSQRGAQPHPISISWETAELAYSVYSANYGRGQSLERLAERGGFGPLEMDAFCPDWRERESQITTLRRQRTRLVGAMVAIVELAGRKAVNLQKLYKAIDTARVALSEIGKEMEGESKSDG